MPGVTPVYGLPYQDPEDPPNGPDLGQDLAEAVEAAIEEAVDRTGYIASGDRTTSSGSITTTETIIQSLTFTAVAGVRYKVTAVQSVQSTNPGESVIVRLRWASGGSVSSSGTQITSLIAPCYTAGLGFPTPLVGTFSPGVNGSVTVGVSIVRNLGTGTISSFGSSAQTNTILVEAV